MAAIMVYIYIMYVYTLPQTLGNLWRFLYILIHTFIGVYTYISYAEVHVLVIIYK